MNVTSRKGTVSHAPVTSDTAGATHSYTEAECVLCCVFCILLAIVAVSRVVEDFLFDVFPRGVVVAFVCARAFLFVCDVHRKVGFVDYINSKLANDADVQVHFVFSFLSCRCVLV